MDIALRPARAEDAEVMARWFAEPASLARWAGPEVDFPLTASQMAAWIGARAAPKPRHCWTAVDAGDAPVGHVQMLHDPRNETVRIGRFGVAPKHRSRGLGAELLRQALAFAFAELGAWRVELGVWAVNDGARRLYERFGFVAEGTARDAAVAAGRRWSVVTMSLLRPEWLGGRVGAAAAGSS